MEMDKIEKKAKELGLEKGYYLLLLAILDAKDLERTDKGKHAR